MTEGYPDPMERAQRMCDACAGPLPEDGFEELVVAVGACEYPFAYHPECRERMQATLDAVSEICPVPERTTSGERAWWRGFAWSEGSSPQDIGRY